MPDDSISVFISYSHNSPQHEARVLALADRLRADGIDAMIDQYQTAPPEGWQLWMEKQIRDAKFVLLVCTETYLRRVMKEDAGKGLGVMWESSIIYSHLYSAGVVNEKFIPIVFDRADTRFIPTPLQPTTYYFVGDDAGYESLYRRLTNQPATPAAPLGKLRALPPLERATASTQPSNYQTIRPNLVHPYALQANFTGRVEERKELTAWLTDDAHPICALVAMGGMGKSALAWVWLTQDILKSEIENRKLDGVMWWSFYEGESSFAKFIDDALKYVSGQPIDAARLPTTYDRALELRRELQNKRVLFVLDGFERQLRAYARLNAAYQRDDATDPSREARACVEPDAARLLKDITAGTTRAKVLITSRLMVSDLEDRAGDPLAGILHRELKSLARDDAIAFMRAQGVTKGTLAEIATVCEAYGNHPLSLRLLSGLIARDTHTPGDIAAAPRHDVHADLVQHQHHVLEQSYNALPEKERALLSRIAAFRSAMTYDALAIFNEFGDDAKFDAALNDLQARGLLQRDTTHNRYDLHPIVRHYCYDRLTDKEGVHTRLRDYFAKIPTPDAGKVKSIEDLAPIIELYHHTVRAGRYDKAVELFRDRLYYLLHYRFGAYQTCIELLHALFLDSEGRARRLKREDAQAWVLGVLANSYACCGQPSKAVGAWQVAKAKYGKTNLNPSRNQSLALSLVIMSTELLNLGELAATELNLQRAIEMVKPYSIFERSFARMEQLDQSRRILSQRLAKIAQDTKVTEKGAWIQRMAHLVEAEEHKLERVFWLLRRATVKYINALALSQLGRLLIYRGAFNKASTELDSAQNIFDTEGYKDSVGMIWAYRAQCTLLMGDTRAALEAAQQARTLADAENYELDIIRAEWLLGAALVMEGKDLNTAATHLTEALTRCRRINLVELEPDILLSWAHWHRVRGNTQEAQALAEEALAIADRCEYRLAQAEIHNFLARWWMDRAESSKQKAGGSQLPSVSEALAEAKQHAEIAKERAWCDGPPHCYKPALDEAERLSKEMG